MDLLKWKKTQIDKAWHNTTPVIVSVNKFNIGPHEAVLEVSKGKVHITKNKHVPIGIDCDFLNTFRFRTRPLLDVDSNDALKRTTLYYSVLQSTGPYYSPVQRTTSVLLRTTILCTKKCYSVLQSTTPYYRVLLQYYSVVLQYYSSTTPVLLCLYYKVLLRTTKYYSVQFQYQ